MSKLRKLGKVGGGLCAVSAIIAVLNADFYGQFRTSQQGLEIIGDAEGCMVIKMQQAGTLSKQTVFNEAKRRGLISDNVEWEDEQARLNEEGVDYDLEFAGQTETKFE